MVLGRHAPRMKGRTKQNVAESSGFGWTSTNWSGYAITGKTGTYNSVSGEWIVPKVKPSNKPTYSSAWVGIDGFNNQSLIQTGTDQDYTNGSSQYYAWWEVLPAAPRIIPFSVSPGDHMRAEIRNLGNGTWSISLINNTKHWTYSTVQTYSGPQASAEWIVEAPSVNGQVATLANYGQTTFDQGAVNGRSPMLVQANGGIMVQQNVQVSTPSVPDKNKDGFAISYGTFNPTSPVSSRKKKTTMIQRPRRGKSSKVYFPKTPRVLINQH